MVARTAALGVVAMLVVGSTSGATTRAQAPTDKVPIVAVTGCVAEQPDKTWMLTAATDPVPSIANAPPATQPHSGPTRGKNSFRLIGTSEFDLPKHLGHIVLVKGLLVKATPVSRINVTSVTMIAATCAAPGR
jgi:hypothetical protein